MARRRAVRVDETAEVLVEARRILQQGDAVAPARGATMEALKTALADDFDETYAAEVAAALLAPAAWRTLKRRLAQRRSGQRTAPVGAVPAQVHLPADIVQALAEIAPSPVEAIRQLLARGRHGAAAGLR